MLNRLCSTSADWGQTAHVTYQPSSRQRRSPTRHTCRHPSGISGAAATTTTTSIGATDNTPRHYKSGHGA
eukprot:1075581-Pyramimonas_sp.AAC.1